LIQASYVVLLFSFLLGFLGTCSFFLLLNLHKSLNKEAYNHFKKMNQKALFVLGCSLVGGVFAMIFQFSYSEPILIQSILIGFNWLSTPLFAKIS
jgi:hypothetical protein